MSDILPEEPILLTEKKGRFGRNQRIACAGYASPLLVTLGLCVWAMAKAPDFGGMLSVVDKWMSHALVYTPLAMGTILVVSGALKAVDSVVKK